ncbi:glycosyltransferase Gtf1 [Clostridium saccharobutylicum]|uniref:Glycosyltransferase Gtf1 n=2 Tax=Clostridium saccharobutylicum TaxID=169679 RepID=A0A1S8MZ82_CLOSA|nr:glycosyltransferase Gtf1 [Clostridium saccharobutylicum]
MVTDKMENKIIFLGKLNRTNCNNGPSGVLKSLMNAGKKIDNIDFKIINTNKEVLKLPRILLYSNYKTVCICSDGFFLTFIIFILSLFDIKRKYYLIIHGIYKIESKYNGIKPNRKTVLIEKIIYKCFPNVICVSEKLKIDIKYYFKRTNNVYVINNGMDLIKLNGSINNFVRGSVLNLIHVGGIKNRKGIYEALELVRALNALNIKVFLNIYGDVIDNKSLTKFYNYIKTYNLSHLVCYNGQINDKEKLYNAYYKSDFNLCLSKYDTFNIAVLESMSVGCPCFVTTNCGASEIVESGMDGYVINQDDYIQQIVSIIKLYLNYSNCEIKKLRLNASIKASKYSWNNVIKQYFALLGKDCD